MTTSIQSCCLCSYDMAEVPPECYLLAESGGRSAFAMSAACASGPFWLLQAEPMTLDQGREETFPRQWQIEAK